MVLYPILLSQSWSTTVPNFMLVSGIAQSGQNLALSRLAKGGSGGGGGGGGAKKICCMFFIPGAKMYPVMMLIHARGSGFFYQNGAIWRILTAPKYIKINLKINNFHG